jgi:hypothetical protein
MADPRQVADGRSARGAKARRQTINVGEIDLDDRIDFAGWRTRSDDGDDADAAHPEFTR